VAVGVLDMALWDALAKAEGLPLWRLLADRYNGGKADDSAWVYAAGGYYYPDEDVASLKAEMSRYLDLGYSVAKMKIGGADLATDIKRIEAALSVVGNDGSRLCVDVNGRFDLDEALAYARAIAPLKLRWYEEPVDPLDYHGLSAVAAEYEGALATGENLFSARDVENLLRFGGLRPDRDILQFDLALSYGIVEYVRILAVLDELGWDRRRCIPHGGHQAAIHAAAGLGLGGNEIYPGVFEPFGLLPDDSAVVDGYVRPTEAPGIGFELIDRLYEVLLEATRS
jgi:L-alanine-DL-glutamate epimerase-like enolase superfamily enzyme